MAKWQKFQNTQTPNSFFDVHLTTLSEAEVKIYLWTARATFGWQKKWDWISNSQFAKNTGLSETSVRLAIKSLLSKRLIARRKNGNSFEYSIPISSKDALTVDNTGDNQENGSDSVGSDSAGSDFEDTERNMESVNKKFNDTHKEQARETTERLVDEAFINKLQKAEAYQAYDVKAEHEKLLIHRNNKPATEKDLLNWMKTARPRKEQKTGKPPLRNTGTDHSIDTGKARVFGKRDYAGILRRLTGEDREVSKSSMDNDGGKVIETTAKSL